MLGNGQNTEKGGAATVEAPAASGARRALRKVSPAVDIYEKNETLYIVADMPGVAKDGVKLDVDRDVLTISARFEGEGFLPGKATYSELAPVEYYRAFALGEDLDPARISATLRNGVLELSLPKAERAKTKKIQIQAE